MILYLDLDGVLANFNKRYQEKFGQFPSDIDRKKQHFWDNWKKWVDDGEFERLELMPGAETLLGRARELQKTGWKVEILSSSAGGYSHDIVKFQKMRWLLRMGIDFYPNIVPGRKHKVKWANSKSVLIDDNREVIDMFSDAGGTGIFHEDVSKTIEELNAVTNSVLCS